MPTSSAPGNVAPAPGFGDLSSLPEMEPIDAAIKAHDWTRAEAALAELDPSDAGFALMGIAEIDEVERLLESAVEPDSGSPWAATALAARWIVIGWSARGGAPASDVSPEQFADFHEWARKAELLLIDVCARHPSFTPAWATRLLTARALELGASEARRRYRRLAAHVPDDFWAQQQLLQHISAKWFGSDEAAAAFAHDTAAASPPGSHSGAILALHHIEMWLAAGAGAPERRSAGQRIPASPRGARRAAAGRAALRAPRKPPHDRARCASPQRFRDGVLARLAPFRRGRAFSRSRRPINEIPVGVRRAGCRRARARADAGPREGRKGRGCEVTVPDVIAEDETGDPTTLSARLAAVSGIVSSATVDGIPAVFAKADGPLNAGLLFRVGWADETFATAGITHLVEHLALAPLSSTDTPHNGATSDHFTHFHVQGTEAEVVEHLNGLCASLRDLPLSRLETEKEILRTEGSRRAAGPAEFGAAERWGARGFGLNLYGEPGLSRIDAAAVQEWVRTRFTAGNAVLWITASALPAGLDLALPSGPRHPIAFGDEVVMRKPAYTVGQTGGVYIEAFVPRSSAAALFARVASRMLFRDLRQIGGYSYVAESRYEPVDPDRARIVVVADALEQQQAAVVGGAVDVLAALRAGAIEDADLAAAKESLRVRSDTALLGGALLPWFAQSLLDGTEILGLDALDRERDAVTVEDIASVATQFHADAVAQVPEGDLEWAGFSPLPRWSETVVDGTEYPRPDEENVALVVGGRGVSLKVGFHAATVMFGDCVGLLVYPDGARVLVGGDGFRVVVEPTLHDGLSAAIVATSIDAVIPDELHIPMPARSPEQIPARPAPAPRPGWRGFGKWATWTSWILTALAIFSLWITIRMALGLTDSSPGSIGEGFIVAGVLFVFAVIFGAGAYARNEYKKSHAPGS